MRIITVKRIQEAIDRYKDGDLAKDLMSWVKVAQGVSWKNFNDLRQTFPKADDVEGVIVFNTDEQERVVSVDRIGETEGEEEGEG